MKRTVQLVPLAIIALFVFSGCYSNKQPQYVNSISATIDSISFSAIGSTDVSMYGDTSTHNPQYVDINGQTEIYIPGTATKPSIRLRIPIVDGTYYLPNNASASVVTSATGSSGTMAISGQIIVLRYAYSRIQGSFNFTCADGTKVTNGQFIGNIGYK